MTEEQAPPPVSAPTAWLVAGGVTIADAIAVAYAFQPERSGKPALLVSIGAMYLTIAVAAWFWFRRRGDDWKWLRPHAGDLTIGAAVAALLYFGGMAGHVALAPHGSPREGWIIRIYLLLGNPFEVSHLVGAGAFVVALLEEAVWRGLVLRCLREALGPWRALAISSVLFAAAHLPTATLLGDPTAGPNPLVIFAGLGCSVVWGYLALRTGRLVPSLFAHALFTWAVIEFPLWRP